MQEDTLLSVPCNRDMRRDRAPVVWEGALFGLLRRKPAGSRYCAVRDGVCAKFVEDGVKWE